MNRIAIHRRIFCSRYFDLAQFCYLDLFLRALVCVRGCYYLRIMPNGGLLSIDLRTFQSKWLHYDRRTIRLVLDFHFSLAELRIATILVDLLIAAARKARKATP